MSFFNNITGSIDNLQKEYLGPDYPYYEKVSTPPQLGMSGRGTLGALASDIAGIVNYVQLLVSGSGRASKTGNPLGNRFFITTGGQCVDYKTKKLVTRSMYINNIPSDKIPIISNMSGMKFPEFRGMVPGILQNLYDINPVRMFRAFMEGNEPLCAEVNLPVIDEDDKKTTQSGYIPIVELLDLANAGNIKENVVTKEMTNATTSDKASDDSGSDDIGDNSTTDKETFINMCDIMNGKQSPYMKSKQIIKELDSLSNIYMISFGLVMLYILYRVMKK